MAQFRSILLLTLIVVAGLAVACGGSKVNNFPTGDTTTDLDDDGTGDATGDVDDDGSGDAPADGTGDAPGDGTWDPDADGTDPGIDPMPEPHPDGTPDTDTDGDTILDVDEGGGAVDTDGDTVPDTEDSDSDGDGIPDSVEAGDSEPFTPPVDSDFDGTPDFRDDDSDGDTIRDSDEGVADVDGDGIPNYRDLDSDGDFLQDFFEAGDSDLGTGPFDHDGDGTPDFLDIDSDNDTISDLDEGNLDTDTDGIYDFLDTDSDGDGISDMLEAGDYDITTPPQNCDTDTLPNYRDTDSDNDGISDRDELIHGTDICDPDTDGDGVSDLIEIAYGSDPLDSTESPRTYGDFVFEVPHMAAPSPTVDTLVFSTDIQKGDVFFLLDTTGSMGGELTNLRTSLSSTIIPGIAARIPDAWYAVGRHDDYPYIPYGDPSSGDVVFQLNQRTTASTTAAQAAVNSLGLHYGYDGPESQTPALWATATGSGLGSYLAARSGCATGERGYPCFRPGAIPIIILMTDAAFHNGYGGTNPYSGVSPTPPNFTTMVAALNAINAKVITVNSGGTYAATDCRQVTIQTGAVDVSGSPLYFEISSAGTGMGTAIIDAVETLVNRVPIRVDAIVTDDPGDSVDAVTNFIDRVQTNTTGVSVWDPVTGTTRVCTTTATATPGTAPTVDYFTAVLPGTSVCFDIYPDMNTTVPPLTTPQIFRAMIEIIGDLYTPLDSRDIYFLVPPVIPGGN